MASARPASVPLEQIMKRVDAEKLTAAMEREDIQVAGQDGRTKTKGKYMPVTLKPMPEPTWRAAVPVLREWEYWSHQASRYPYITESVSQNDHYITGISVHPRLSDFPQCKDVIDDVFRCMEYNPFLRVTNMCAPIKEQMCACLNMVFLKNSKKKSSKFEAEKFSLADKRREKHLVALAEKAREIQDRTNNLSD